MLVGKSLWASRTRVLEGSQRMAGLYDIHWTCAYDTFVDPDRGG